MDPALGPLVQAALNDTHQRSTLADARVPADTIESALQPVQLSVSALEPPSPDTAARAVAAIASGFVLCASLGAWGSVVSNGVAQEKT
jgi:predicted nucleotidyltransferase